MQLRTPSQAPHYCLRKNTEVSIYAKLYQGEDLQDGGRVRRGDHLPPHKYIRNTSTCGTASTEHLLNTGRRPQTSQKGLGAPVGTQACVSEVGEPSSGHWSTRDLPAPRNIKGQKLSQKSPSQC